VLVGEALKAPLGTIPLIPFVTAGAYLHGTQAGDLSDEDVPF
jgi:hypothetical protein